MAHLRQEPALVLVRDLSDLPRTRLGLNPVTLAQGHDAKCQVASQFVENLHFLGIENISFLGTDDQHCKSQVLALQWQCHDASIAKPCGLLTPGGRRRVIENVADHSGLSGPQRDATRSLAVRAIPRPGFSCRWREKDLGASVGRPPPCFALILLRKHDPRQAMTSLIDSNAADLLQQSV